MTKKKTNKTIPAELIVSSSAHMAAFVTVTTENATTSRREADKKAVNLHVCDDKLKALLRRDDCTLECCP